MKPSVDIAIIGPGKVGTTIALSAIKSGYRIAALAGRDRKKTEEAAKTIGGDIPIYTPLQAASVARLVLFTVTDSAIESLCTDLAKNKAFSENQIVVHCSGALSSEVLAAARDLCGATIASAHPLQTFSTVQSAASAMPGAYWFCEGDKAALDVITQLIHRIGGVPNIIPSDKKVLYHCASVFACNYLVSLMDVALSVAESASLDRDLAWQALSPLIQSTIANIGKLGTDTVLTGPITRGDVETVASHLHALAGTDNEIAEIYRVMGKWTTQIAQKKGLSQERARALFAELLVNSHALPGK
jgi:predicted short-subunit dehydrogenase-like oxidoreductase (DUF2520 family)